MTQTEALIAIAKRDGGTLTPAAVIAEARNKKSVLHNAFTWDDTEAAHKWRVLEAQRLIRRCEIVVEKPDGQEVKTFAFIGLNADRFAESENNPYRLASDVGRSDSLVSAAERDALDQLAALRARYCSIKRLRAVWAAIDAACGA